MMGEEKKEANAVADLVGVLIAAEFGALRRCVGSHDRVESTRPQLRLSGFQLTPKVHL